MNKEILVKSAIRLAAGIDAQPKEDGTVETTLKLWIRLIQAVEGWRGVATLVLAWEATVAGCWKDALAELVERANEELEVRGMSPVELPEGFVPASRAAGTGHTAWWKLR